MSSAPFSEDPSQYSLPKSQSLISQAVLVDLIGAVFVRGLPFRFTALGYSMSPFIQDGDIITLAPLANQPLSLGEVVAYSMPGRNTLVVHRVLAKSALSCLIQGDNHPSGPDGEIPFSNLIGRVIHVERQGRRDRVGLGPERRLIALLSRRRLLVPLVQHLVQLKRLLSCESCPFPVFQLPAYPRLPFARSRASPFPPAAHPAGTRLGCPHPAQPAG